MLSIVNKRRTAMPPAHGDGSAPGRYPRGGVRTAGPDIAVRQMPVSPSARAVARRNRCHWCVKPALTGARDTASISDLQKRGGARVKNKSTQQEDVLKKKPT